MPVRRGPEVGDSNAFGLTSGPPHGLRGARGGAVGAAAGPSAVVGGCGLDRWTRTVCSVQPCHLGRILMPMRFGKRCLPACLLNPLLLGSETPLKKALFFFGRHCSGLGPVKDGVLKRQ